MKLSNKMSSGNIINYIMIGIVGFITVFPFLYILSISISSAAGIASRKVLIWPIGFSLESYKYILNDDRISTGFINSIIYTLLATVISVFMTMITAYPLSDDKFKKYGNVIMGMIIFTMLFSGGLIPYYLVIRKLGFINKIWAMIIPGAISPFYLILARVFIRQLPSELHDSATVDGANEADIFARIILPLCKPIVACLILYISVGVWNAYLAPILFMTDPKKWTLQVFLRNIVIGSDLAREMSQAMSNTTEGRDTKFISEAIKACVLVVSTVPILVLYPFVQKYFVKGIMLGAVKG